MKKVSDITTKDIAEYIKVPDSQDLQTYIDVSKSFITNYTGLALENLDEHEDFVIVVYILSQDMYDNRTLYVDKSELNRVVSTILDMHRQNLGV